MARLLDGSESIRRSLPETPLGKQSMKLHQASHRNARFAHVHAGAQRPIQHPLCNLNDLTRPDLYSDDRAIGSVLATFVPKTAAVIWMPAIMKLHYLPDMGTMTQRWRWAENPGCSADPTEEVSAPRRCIVSS
jgi:hypothetical protein